MHSSPTSLANAAMVTKVMELLIIPPVILPMTDNLPVQPCRHIQHPLNDSLEMMACRLSGLSSRNDAFLNRQGGLSQQATSMSLASWKPGTSKQYKTCHARWFQHCGKEKIDPFCASIESVIEFLTYLFHSGLCNSALNIASGALSSLGLVYEGFTAGSHPLVIRFLKGVYNLRPSKPRYTHTWDVSVVLQYLRTLSPVKTLSLKNLTLKLVMLISLTCATRLQSIHCLKLHHMTKKKSSFEFCYDELLKTSRPNFVVPKTILKACAPDRRLCVFTVMCKYLSRTVTLKPLSQLAHDHFTTLCDRTILASHDLSHTLHDHSHSLHLF